MEPKSSGPSRETLDALALVGQLGVAVTAPIVAGVIAGIYLSDAIGGGWGVVVLIAGVVIGVGGAVAAGYRILAPFLNK